MAGLDSEGSPFNGNARDHIQSFQKSFNKSNGFSGDISSNGHINNSFGISEKPVNGNVRPKPYLSNSYLRDPVMNDSQDQSGYINESHDEAQKRRDELYEKILRDTSSAFNRINEQNITLDVSANTTGTLREDKMADESKYDDDDDDLKPAPRSPEKMPRSKIPRPGVRRRGTDSDTDQDQSHLSDKKEIFKTDGEIIMSFDADGLTPRDDEAASPERGGQTSRVSDFSYGMDSFEQSYVSERGEVVHLGDDMDFPESPSPVHQDSDNDDF